MTFFMPREVGKRVAILALVRKKVRKIFGERSLARGLPGLRGMSRDLLHELSQQIAQGRMLAVAGAGISIAATGDDRLASWTGLLRHGAERCVEAAGPLPEGWAER